MASRLKEKEAKTITDRKTLPHLCQHHLIHLLLVLRAKWTMPMSRVSEILKDNNPGIGIYTPQMLGAIYPSIVLYVSAHVCVYLPSQELVDNTTE